MTNDASDMQLLTVPEAAKVLRIGRNLAYELIARGELPSVRLGRAIRVPRSALERWLEREASATSHVDTSFEDGRMHLPAAPPRAAVPTDLTE